MDGPSFRFLVFVLVSLLAFALTVRFALRRRAVQPSAWALAAVSALVVVGGMSLARYGHNAGLPWWVYYTVPALATLLLPPLSFRFSRRELVPYLALAFLSSPVIHVLFSFFLGWHEYLPFLPVPSLRSLVG